MHEDSSRQTLEHEWLWGWDATPGIVSIWADRGGEALVWRRLSRDAPVICERERFRPWVLLPSLDSLRYLGDRLFVEGPDAPPSAITYRALDGEGHLRYLVSCPDGRRLEAAVLRGVSEMRGYQVARLADLGDDEVLCLAPEDQYLVATGRSYFCDLAFDDLHRMQFDLETTGLHPEQDAIFLISVRTNRGIEHILDSTQSGLSGPEAEADLINRFAALMRECDPDVIENHNLLGFDLPFMARRAELLGIPLRLSRVGAPHLGKRPGTRGYGPTTETSQPFGDVEHEGNDQALLSARRGRYTIPGRECIDTLDAVRRYDFAARDLPGHGLKAVARHFGLSPANREYIEGSEVFATWQRDPDRVRRYALDDVIEAAGVAELLGGAAFALARMAPRRYERLADAGPATGILDPLLVRAYLRANAAIPPYTRQSGVQHNGAALHLFACGVARRVVKADVSSLYPSLMRQYAIGPKCDYLGALLALVDRLVEQRLAAKMRAKAAPPGSSERHTNEALSAAMKILVNSAYGYMGATGLTRLADVEAANEVTRRGREVLGLICRELRQRGVTLLEGDTDGVYFSVPDDWTEADERSVVADVAKLLPPLVRLEFEGRYAAMLSHEPKNYALLTYDGELILRGVAFRSSRFEPFGNVFLRRAIASLLADDIAGVREAYLATEDAIRRRELPVADVATQVRLTKAPEQYTETRASRREGHYEALLDAGRTWRKGDRARIYRATGNHPAPLVEIEGESPRDYDIAYYVRLLRETYVARLARAFTPDDFAALFASATQPTLFDAPLDAIRPVLTSVAVTL